MAHRPPTRRGALAVLIAAVAAVVPVTASAAPVTAGAAVMADSEAIARIVITKRIEDPAPTITLPGATDVPSSWTCTTTPGNKTITVSCTPAVPAPSGQWVCPSVWVVASAFGLPNDTVIGTAECSGESVSCNPQKLLQTQSFCSEHADWPAPPPFVCKANYIGVNGSDWTVTCKTKWVPPGGTPVTRR